MSHRGMRVPRPDDIWYGRLVPAVRPAPVRVDGIRRLRHHAPAPQAGSDRPGGIVSMRACGRMGRRQRILRVLRLAAETGHVILRCVREASAMDLAKIMVYSASILTGLAVFLLLLRLLGYDIPLLVPLVMMFFPVVLPSRLRRDAKVREESGEYCSECGYPLDPDDGFCKVCGKMRRSCASHSSHPTDISN